MDIPRNFMVVLIIAVILTASVSLAFSQMLQGNLNPIVEAHADLITGTVPLTIQFSCNCYDPDGSIEQVLWRFGDGSTSDKKTVNHTYQWKGHFTAVLTVWDDDGMSSFSTIDILVDQNNPPDVSINANTTYGHPPLKISFSADGCDDGYVASYLWDFDDGQTSHSQYPTHWFNDTGIYLVDCTATDNDGLTDDCVLEIYVIEQSVPQAFAMANKYRGKAPLIIQFSGDVIDEDSEKHHYYWSFDDRMLQKYDESFEKNCSHIFFSPGLYRVEFTVTDEDGGVGKDIVIIEVRESLFSRLMEASQSKIINMLTTEFLPGFIYNISKWWIINYIQSFFPWNS